MHLKLEGKRMLPPPRSLSSNIQKNHLADAMINQLFISLHEGMFAETSIDWGANPSTIVLFNPFYSTPRFKKYRGQYIYC